MGIYFDLHLSSERKKRQRKREKGKNFPIGSLSEEKIRLLEESRNLENRLARTFGIRTAFSAKQKEQIAEWTAMGLSEELIVEAYNRCMDHSGKMSFAYMAKVLANWAEKGVKKVADIEEQTKVATGNQQHQGLSELEKMGIGMMQYGGNE